jgi:phenylpyruvate tautomerase PptA (4-oxalocrotonate tautomerase family)
MAQVKVYGLKAHLARNRAELSAIIHASLVKVLGLPPEKRFQRFLPLDPEDFLFPADRTPAYTIVEISMFAGRSEEKLKALIQDIMKETQERLRIHPNDLEITVFQSPKHCWGIRGKTGDELALGYQVDV